MLKKKKTVVRAFAVLGFSVFLMGAEPSCTGERPIELSIFHTNDLHSRYHPPKSDQFDLGGFARLKTLIDRLRPSRTVSLLLDAGDYSEGNWYFDLDAGANTLRMLGLMGYDGTVVGNHDYLAGPDRLMQSVINANVNFPVLAANWDFTYYENAEEFKKHVPPTAILERGGLKIGLIGLTTVDFAFASYVQPLVATEPIRAAQEYAKILRPQVDVLIVVSHNLIEVNRQVAKAVAGLDAVISGHSHHKVPVAELVDNAGKKVPVVETGSWGTFLGDLRLNVYTGQKRVEFAGYDLHPVHSELPEDPAMKAAIDAEDRRLSELYGKDVNEIVAHSEVDLHMDSASHASLANIATKAYRKATGADAALESLKLIGTRWGAGDVSIAELHDVMPHIFNFDDNREWTIKLWDARGEDLLLILNILYTAGTLVPILGDGLLVFDNMEITWDRESHPGAVVKSVTIGGLPIQPGNRYAIAITDGMIEAFRIAQDLLGITIDFSRLTDTGIQGSDAVIAYGQEVKTFHPHDLLENAHNYSAGPDPALAHYEVSYAGGFLAVGISNLGFEETGRFKLKCFRGKINDAVSYDTEIQEFTSIAEVGVSSIPPLDKVTIQIPWDPSPGYWPVMCETESERDGNKHNSDMQKVIRVSAR